MNRIRKASLTGSAVAAALVLGACTEPHVDAVRQMETSGTTYHAKLARDYKDLSLYEQDRMYDTIDADRFAAKALMAKAHGTVMPEEPGEWNIDNAEKLAELRYERIRLLAAMQNEAALKTVPAAVARAQAKYDCWVEQQEEGHQPTHIAACRGAYLTAMTHLDEKLAIKAVAKPKVAIVVPEPAPSRLPQSLVVSFAFDSAALSPKARTIIGEAVKTHARNEVGRIVIVGHADRAGPKGYNYNLSLERGQAVREMLARRGIPRADITVRAEGETQPMVQTGDGVRDAANRVVLITMERTTES